MPLFSQIDKRNNFRFFSLGSGSSGNCYFFGCKEYGILIDAGLSIRGIMKTLKEYGSGLQKIRAVLITHDHADHIKTASCLSNKHNIPIYATDAVHRGIERSRYVPVSIPNYAKKIIKKGESFNIEDLEITSFDVPHDSLENTGYRIKFSNQIFALATDVGAITPEIEANIRTANHIVFEANYDDAMLWSGRYPQYLKERITSGSGHISNKLAAAFLAKIYNANVKNIWLCHLSQDNNSPEVAFDEVARCLKLAGARVGENIHIEVLKRFKASGLREL